MNQQAATPVLTVDYEKCTGCRACETACSVFHVHACNPLKSAVRIVKWHAGPKAGFNVPVVCQQCEEPACANICPVQAISRNEQTGAMVIDPDLCVGCQMCVVACPFGAVTLDRDRRQAIKCDLCGGAEPWCVRVCEPGALTCKPAPAVSLDKQRAAVRRWIRLQQA